MSDKMSDKLNKREKSFLETLVKQLKIVEYVTTTDMSNITNIPASTIRRYAKDDEEFFRETKGTMIIRMNKGKGSFTLYLSTEDKEFLDKKISTFIIESNKIYEKNE